MQPTSRAIQVILTAGPRQAARAELGLEAALAARASALDVTVFLTLDATEWACMPRRRGVGRRVYELLDELEALGAAIGVCSACAQEQCSQPRGSATAGSVPTVSATDRDFATTLTPATATTIELVGLAALMERVANGVPTVTF